MSYKLSVLCEISFLETSFPLIGNKTQGFFLPKHEAPGEIPFLWVHCASSLTAKRKSTNGLYRISALPLTIIYETHDLIHWFFPHIQLRHWLGIKPVLENAQKFIQHTQIHKENGKLNLIK